MQSYYKQSKKEECRGRKEKGSQASWGFRHAKKKKKKKGKKGERKREKT